MGFAIIIILFLIIYFSIMTYKSYLNYKDEEDTTTLVLVFIFGILPIAFLLFWYIVTLFEK